MLRNQPIVQHNAVSHIPYCFSSIWYCQLFSFSTVLSYYYSIIYVSAWCPAGFVPFVTCLNVHMSPFYLSNISIILVDLSAPGFYFDFTVLQQDLMCKTFSHIHVSHRFLGIAYISTRLLRLTEKEKCEQHFLKISLSSSNSTSKLEQTWLTHCSLSLLPFPPLR